MNVTEATLGRRVVYLPPWTHGDRTHPAACYGTVSSDNGRWIFVRFDAQVCRLGWEGTTAQACRPVDLSTLGGGDDPVPFDHWLHREIRRVLGMGPARPREAPNAP